MLYLGDASRRQQHCTLLGSAVETHWEQGPIPLSLSCASTALLLCQADSRPHKGDPPALWFSATWLMSVSESLLSLLELLAVAAFVAALAGELGAVTATFA